MGMTETRTFTATHTLHGTPVAMGDELEQSFVWSDEAYVHAADGGRIICRRRELTEIPTAAPPAPRNPFAGPVPAPAAARKLDDLVGDATRVNASRLAGSAFLPAPDKAMAALDRAHALAVRRFDPRRTEVAMTTAQIYALKRRGYVTIVDYTLRDARGRRRPCWIEITPAGQREAASRAHAAANPPAPIRIVL